MSLEKPRIYIYIVKQIHVGHFNNSFVDLQNLSMGIKVSLSMGIKMSLSVDNDM